VQKIENWYRKVLLLEFINIDAIIIDTSVHKVYLRIYSEVFEMHFNKQDNLNMVFNFTIIIG